MNLGMTKMDKHQIFKMLNDGGNKEFYKNWFISVCSEISKLERKELNESEMESLLKIYFKQLKEGGN